MQSIPKDHSHYMALALREARAALETGDVPVGAVVVHDDRVIGRAHNQRELLQDPTAHAEMIALTQAAAALESWRLLDCDLYVTKEPCPMCAGAIVNARLRRVIYAIADAKGGGCQSLYQIPTDSRLNHQVEIVEGIRSEECLELIQSFFQQKRRREACSPNSSS
jgi:tRNA(adenine34) deaminase